MLLWFVAVAVCVVLFVFDSPAVDYRFVAAGGVLPLLEAITGRPYILHTLLGSVALMTLAMVVTIGRRVLRRRLLGIPIGTFVFLVASTSWTRTELFWWPVAGLDEIGVAPLPEYSHPVVVLVLLELAGIGLLVWVARRFRMTVRANRAELRRTGRLPHLGKVTGEC
ncbi:MAG: hypothetical protein HOH36_12475 [Acidimicrobiaceae bacterium]|nr:hypothetical protein [Acidimicrobiaceae bacterium]MBT5851242.1 hypothetical protein [Acidimicrobiaceae bacterium]